MRAGRLWVHASMKQRVGKSACNREHVGMGVDLRVRKWEMRAVGLKYACRQGGEKEPGQQLGAV